MRLVSRLSLAVCAVLLPAVPGLASDPLPPACDVLQALPDTVLPPDAVAFQTMQDRQTDAMTMSLCMANDTDGLPAASLLLRQSISATTPPASATQRDTMVAELGDTFGQAPTTRPLDLGEASVWVEDIKQAMVWYRDGRVLLIVTAGGKDGETIAGEIAAAIVAAFP